MMRPRDKSRILKICWNVTGMLVSHPNVGNRTLSDESISFFLSSVPSCFNTRKLQGKKKDEHHKHSIFEDSWRLSKDYLFIWKTEQWRQKGEVRVGGNEVEERKRYFPLAGSFPKWLPQLRLRPCQSQQPAFSRVNQLGGRHPSTWVLICCLSDELVISWVGNAELQGLKLALYHVRSCDSPMCFATTPIPKS